jgi:hypothetical protein
MSLFSTIDKAIGLTATQRIGIVCAAFALYILVFFAFTSDMLQLWPEVFVVFLSIGLAIKLGEDHQGINTLFFSVLAFAFTCDFFNVLFLQLGLQFGPEYNFTLIEPIVENSADRGVLINSIFYGGNLFIWICAWIALIVHHARQLREGKLYLMLAPLLIAGSVFILQYQLQNFDFHFDRPKERLDFSFLVMEIIGVQLCLFCVLMGAERGLLLIIIGFVIGAGNDVLAVFSNLQLQNPATSGSLAQELLSGQKDLDAIWALGKTMTLLGLLSLPQHYGDADRSKKLRLRLINPRDNHSGISIYLMLFWLLTIGVGMYATASMHEEPHLLTMFIIVFSSISVIAIAEATIKLDRAVDFLSLYIQQLFASQLSGDNLPVKRRSTSRWLEMSGLEGVIEKTNEAAAEMQKNVIFLGPERLNRPATIVDDSKRTTCFLVMPFSMDWSDSVTKSLRKVCKGENIYALRGDDIFRPTDILDDIWNGIMQSQFVIADITGNNANVFYELGMAHAIGTPVIVLAQDANEVPFDLKSRRILIYETDKLDEMEASLKTAIKEVMGFYKLEEPSENANPDSRS